MKKSENKLTARREHVRDFVNNYKGHTVSAVAELSKTLFLSPATIWSDLKKGSKD